LDDKKDVNKQLERLERFSKEAPPPEIPAKYEEAFSSLKRDVTYFKGQFDEYAEVQGQATAEKIKKIERELKTLEDQLTKLNKQVQDWTKALAITSWVPMIASYIADIGLQIVTKRRDEQAQKVKTKTDELARANKDQVALKKLVTDLSVAEHNFDEISTSLVLLSKIWSDMHSMAQKLATLLKAAAEHKGKDQEVCSQRR
jgi:DNA repair exonuclease SbcCD ATPase subunit